MENNIYDLTISELILRDSSGASSGSTAAARVVLTNSLNTTELKENYNGSIDYTSSIYGIPSGYTIKTGTHIISYPNGAPDTVSSSSVSTGASTTIILGALGSTFVVNTTVTLEKSGEADIILTDTHTITAVLPLYYGVKADSLTPDTTGLSSQANSALTFSMTNSILGRIYVVLPTTASPIITITSSNGNIYPVSDFNVITSGSLVYYILTWDTQLTGTNLKYFTINFS
jgi:hypothetical protein